MLKWKSHIWIYVVISVFTTRWQSWCNWIIVAGLINTVCHDIQNIFIYWSLKIVKLWMSSWNLNCMLYTHHHLFSNLFTKYKIESYETPSFPQSKAFMNSSSVKDNSLAASKCIFQKYSINIKCFLCFF